MEVLIKSDDTIKECKFDYDEMKQMESELKRISQEIFKYIELIVNSQDNDIEKFIKLVIEYIDFIDDEYKKDVKILDLLCVLVDNKAPDKNTCGVIIDDNIYYCPRRVLKSMKQIMHDNNIDFLN